MKEVNLYVEGTYNKTADSGSYTYYLEYKGAIKKCSNTKNGDARSCNRMILFGIIDAVKRFNEPCKVNIKTRTSVGFSNPTHSKNKDLLEYFNTMVYERGHQFEVDDRADFLIVRQWEDAYGLM